MEWVSRDTRRLQRGQARDRVRQLHTPNQPTEAMASPRIAHIPCSRDFGRAVSKESGALKSNPTPRRSGTVQRRKLGNRWPVRPGSSSCGRPESDTGSFMTATSLVGAEILPGLDATAPLSNRSERVAVKLRAVSHTRGGLGAAA